jgi:hypothetical protein
MKPRPIDGKPAGPVPRVSSEQRSGLGRIHTGPATTGEELDA